MSSDIGVIPQADSTYPRLLQHIHNPPSQLYYRGNISLLNNPRLLAVIGSRKGTSYGREVIQKLLPSCIESGIVIVSGLAYGIDTLAHRACVELKASTIAVLGTGVDDSSIYPRENLQLAHEILQYGGLIISEYKPGTPPHPSHFPARNRIIAGITSATLVIQAALRSGSLITARLAMESNQEVLAVPGPITDSTSEGANMLIRDGATPIVSAADILSIFEGIPTQMQGTQKTLLIEKT
jgi:DNA processing protein